MTSEIEKRLSSRRADISIIINSGEQVAVEIQHSLISVNDLRQRTLDYNSKGIYVLWILHGEGNSVGSKKYPENK